MLKFYKKYLMPVFKIFMVGGCRFTPTCSEYAEEAVAKYGGYGIVLALKRVLRCHPWAGVKYDPVK